MELIKRYIYAIEKRLYGKGKSDIVKEIESIIMDELEGKYGLKEIYSKEEIESVLVEMGHPREVAARYRGEKQYLIGPELFPFYKMVVSIVIGATMLGLIISFIVERFTTDLNALYSIKDFFTFIPTLFSAFLGGIGGTTVAFAIIERLDFDKKDLDINGDWSPKELVEIPSESERVRMWEPIVAITFTIIWAIFINVYVRSGVMPFVTNLPSNITILPIFNIETASRILPYWNLSIVGTLILQLILLRKGKWQLGTKIIELGLSIFSIVIMSVLLGLPMIFSAESLSTFFMDEAFSVLKIEMYYYFGIKVLMVLTSIGVVVNAIKLIINQTRKANV